MKSRLFLLTAVCVAAQLFSLPVLAQNSKMSKMQSKKEAGAKKTGSWINHGSKNINHWFNGTSKKINKGTNQGSKKVNHVFQGKK